MATHRLSTSAFWKGFISGLTAPFTVFYPGKIQTPPKRPSPESLPDANAGFRKDRENLRRDFANIFGKAQKEAKS